MNKEHKARTELAGAGCTNSKHNKNILLHKARLGDEHALSDLVRMIRPRLLGMALRIVYNRADAEDVVQTALHIGKYRDTRKATYTTLWQRGREELNMSEQHKVLLCLDNSQNSFKAAQYVRNNLSDLGNFAVWKRCMFPYRLSR